MCLFLFFFFKQKTAYEMRISDWSSDVCSSDLRVKHSDGLLTLLLRARMPERYGRTMAQPTVREATKKLKPWETEEEDDPVEARRIVHERLNRMADRLKAEQEAKRAAARMGGGDRKSVV